jgi:hypothetical protein
MSIDALRKVVSYFNCDNTVISAANLAERTHPNSMDEELMRTIENDAPELFAQTKDLRAQGFRICSPQAFLALAKLAIESGSRDQNSPSMPVTLQVSIAMCLQDHFGETTGPDNSLSLAMELVANNWLHRRLDPTTELNRFQERWLSEDPRSISIRKLFVEQVGFDVELMCNLGIGLATMNIDKQEAFFVGIDEAEVLEPIGLISADAERLREEISLVPQRKNTVWHFSFFHRFPIYRCLDGRYVVIQNAMLLRRTMGWPLVYDALYSNPHVNNRAVVSQIEKMAEEVAYEKIYGTLNKAWPGRVVSEKTLMEVFGGIGVQTADLAVEFADAWLVIEISARRASYKALDALDEKDYNDLVEQIAEEAAQAVATSKNLVSHSQNPSERFRFIVPTSKMYPLVILTEGFPVNPFLVRDVRNRVEQLVSGPISGVVPVEIVDAKEMDDLLWLSQTHGISIIQILEEKTLSNFWSDSMNNFLWVHYREQLLA